MVPKYVQKLPTVEALEFTGGLDNAQPIIDWVNANGGLAVWQDGPDGGFIRANTKFGLQTFGPGNYLVKGGGDTFAVYDKVEFEKEWSPENTY